jgi:hypothetical protein
LLFEKERPIIYIAVIHIFWWRSGDGTCFGDWFPQRTVATHGVETFGHVMVGGMIVVGIDCEILALSIDVRNL